MPFGHSPILTETRKLKIIVEKYFSEIIDYGKLSATEERLVEEKCQAASF